MAALTGLEEFLTCPVCWEPYSTSEGSHLPKLTSCNHTLCEECLGVAIALEKPCPVCRGELNSDCISEHNTSIEALDVLPLVASGPGQVCRGSQAGDVCRGVPADRCPEEGECHGGTHEFCTSSKVDHIPILHLEQTHVAFTSDGHPTPPGKRRSPRPTPQPEMCEAGHQSLKMISFSSQSHREKPSFYCEHCETSICHLCAASSLHADHPVSIIDKVMEDKLSEIAGNLAAAEDMICDGYKPAMEHIETVESQLAEQHRQLSASLNRS